MIIKYYIEKECKEKQNWSDGYFTYGIETNLQRAVKMAKEIVEKDKRKARIKAWNGDIIFETIN